MSKIYLYTLMDHASKLPRCVGVSIGDNIKIYDLYRPGTGRSLNEVRKIISKIRDLIIMSNDRGNYIITSDFKQAIAVYDLPTDHTEYYVYDVHLESTVGDIKSTNSQSKDALLVKKILEKMINITNSPYQNMIANAGVVYYNIEKRGITVNDEVFYPKWSMNTYSGRSKSTGFNIQGFNEEHAVSIPGFGQTVLLQFDWISADIKMAAILSGDMVLQDSFKTSDPYTRMLELVKTNESDVLITRDDCKLYLLKSINSMDFTSDAFQIYPKLGSWIRKCKNLADSEISIETILGRKFRVSKQRNGLAVLNGVMQGSVAHAMNSVIIRAWNKIGSYIIAEIHDSLILAVPRDNFILRSIIDIVIPIMTRPFDNNHFFPTRVSIGKKWRQWKLLETHRESGVERAKRCSERIEEE